MRKRRHSKCSRSKKREASPTIYPIDAEIPVNIFDGKLVLKFERIAQWAEEA